MKMLLILVFTLTSPILFSSQVQFTGIPSLENVGGLSIPVYPEAKVAQPDGSYATVKLSGKGIYSKSIVFISVKVYFMASYVTYPEALTLANPLKGIAASPVRLLHMTLLRALTGTEIRTALEDSLDYNNVNIENPAVLKLLDEVDGFEGAVGQKILFGSLPGKHDEMLFFELPLKNFFGEDPFVGYNHWKVWFGKPFDSGLKDLQKSLIGKKPHFN